EILHQGAGYPLSHPTANRRQGIRRGEIDCVTWMMVDGPVSHFSDNCRCRGAAFWLGWRDDHVTELASPGDAVLVLTQHQRPKRGDVNVKSPTTLQLLGERTRQRWRAALVPALFLVVAENADLGTRVPTEKDRQPLLAADRDRFARFEQQLDQLRTLLKIPRLSAAIVRDQQVAWDKGFGFADREKRVLATPETPYHIASLTKTFAATLILRLVEQGQLDPEEPGD